MAVNVAQIAEDALREMRRAGFEAAQVSVAVSEQDELNLNHNEPSLLRSTEDHAVSLIGIVDQRKAATALTDVSPHAIESAVGKLLERAGMSPRDEANGVSEGQVDHFEQGPLEVDRGLLTQKAEELLDFRRDETPKVQIEEGAVSHRLVRECVLTTGGSRLTRTVGAYGLALMSTATDGDQSSSLHYANGTANDLSRAHASEFFGIGDMMRDSEEQIHTRSIPGNFVGDIILAPTAVRDLLGWLLGQLRDFSLIANTSLYKGRVGEQIANERLTIRSHFDAPGQAPFTEDAFRAPALTLLDSGRLTCLIPSYYGSRKTGLAHTPATPSGWRMDTGSTARADLVAGISQGAMVNRLSMGAPAPNGDFSGLIKNSFYIENGRLDGALSETMIAGNMANMLNDIVAISEEHLDLGGDDLPWIRVAGLHFS